MFLNRKIMAALLFMSVTACLSLAATADDKAAFKQNAKYMKYVGTYYTDNGQTVTIHSDGTQTTVPAIMYNTTSADSGSVIRTTPAQGVWREVGKNEIQITNIRFWTDGLGDDYRPDGLIFKATFLAVFDEPVGGQCLGFTVEAENLLIEYFKPDQNPITDEPFLVTAGANNYKAYRLQTTQPGS